MSDTLAPVIPIVSPTHEPPERHPRLCTARNRRGAPCGRFAIRGGTVCLTHGGRAPQVRAKAQLRLAELVFPAIATLAREMTSSPVSAVRLKAATEVLDRTGYVRGVTPEADIARHVLIARLVEMQGAEP